MSDNVEHIEKSLRSVIQVLQDGHKGLAESGKEMKDPSVKTFFLEESQVRAQFASELENQLHRLGFRDVDESGTIAGAIHRTWADLKAKLGGGDHTLLVTAEQGEDEAKQAYEKSIGDHLPGDIEDLLRKQQQHIIQAHNKVRAWRDATKHE